MPLEKNFEELINGYIETNVGIAEHFVSKELANHLKQNLLSLYHQDLLLTAGTGNAKKLNHNTEVRSDVIYWLDRKHENQHENDFLIVLRILYFTSTKAVMQV